MLYLLLAVAIAVGVTVYLIKKGKIKDADGDFIPDVIEDKVKDIKQDVKELVEEAKDIPAKLSRKKPGPKKNSNPAPRTGGGSGAGYYSEKRKAEK